MKVIGFNFTRLSINKPDKSQPTEKVDIETKMDIISLAEVKDHPLKTSDNAISVDFEYIVDYKPDFAKIEIKGKVLLMLDPKLAKEVIKSWEKKEVPEEFRMFLFNIVLRKSTLKALQLEEELNLPLHVPMPSFRKSEDKK
ncbi:MAG: hypothetical protein KKC19_00165 [Nanoarchaeota archaeon]|nr:hypothetical protein [Nanoarchaeota archaeon]